MELVHLQSQPQIPYLLQQTFVTSYTYILLQLHNQAEGQVAEVPPLGVLFDQKIPHSKEFLHFERFF